MFGSAFGEAVDHILFSDTALTLLGLIAFPAAHVAALIAALKAKRPEGIFAVNAAFAFLVVFYLISQPEYYSDIFEGGADPMWLPAGVEFVVLVCALAALFGVRVAKGLSYVFFAVDAAALLIFALLALAGGGSR